MTQIAYTQRACHDQERITDFLRTQRVGVLGACTPMTIRTRCR